MKKVVIFGGGSGLSQILKGLKLFPLDITAVVSVADNGASTGRLRKDLNIPAVGDISKVMLAMSSLGEEQITKCASKIKKVEYNQKITINPEVLKAVDNSDLIIFSSGSLLTSIAPHLINKTLVKSIKKSPAPKIYICNLFTQPGETDNFTVSDHIKILENYLGSRTINAVVANNNMLNNELVNIYQTKEQKDPVELDVDNLKKLNIEILADNLAKIEDSVYRHDSLKTAYLIFSYLMNKQ